MNHELDARATGLTAAVDVLRPGGRLVVLSYHSLEDRQVKQAFRRLAAAGEMKVLTKKPIMPSEEEIRENPRARSARMRVAEKIGAAGPQEEDRGGIL